MQGSEKRKTSGGSAAAKVPIRTLPGAEGSGKTEQVEAPVKAPKLVGTVVARPQAGAGVKDCHP